jgi:hypothetical protein
MDAFTFKPLGCAESKRNDLHASASLPRLLLHRLKDRFLAFSHQYAGCGVRADLPKDQPLGKGYPNRS